MDGFSQIVIMGLVNTYTYMNDTYFSKSNTDQLKGLLAVLVLIHHTYQKPLIGADIPFIDFTLRSLGYLCVSMSSLMHWGRL